MTWDQIQGKWKQVKGSVRERWGRLTDSDFDQIAGNREKFIGRLQERYGYTREKAENELNEWLTASGTQTPKTRTGESQH